MPHAAHFDLKLAEPVKIFYNNGDIKRGVIDDRLQFLDFAVVWIRLSGRFDTPVLENITTDRCFFTWLSFVLLCNLFATSCCKETGSAVCQASLTSYHQEPTFLKF